MKIILFAIVWYILASIASALIVRQLKKALIYESLKDEDGNVIGIEQESEKVQEAFDDYVEARDEQPRSFPWGWVIFVLLWPIMTPGMLWLMNHHSVEVAYNLGILK